VKVKEDSDKQLLAYLSRNSLIAHNQINFKLTYESYPKLRGMTLSLVFKADDGKAVIEKTLTIHFKANPYVLANY
jgi:hypothetical protein